MFSRTSAAVVVGLSCLSILASGCFVGEDPPAPKLVGGQIGSFQSSCVAKIPPGVRDYFLGNLQDDNQIGALWDCGISALQAFELLVRSDQPGVIPSKDLLKFLNGYLNEADKLSEDLRLAAMKLKAAFLGGDSDNLTTRELDQTIEILGILKRGTINLKTLMPVLPTHISGLARGQLGGLIATLQSTGVELGSYVAGHGGDYSFDDAGKLLIEFEKVYLKNAAPDNVVRWLREQLPVLRILKSVVVGGSADKVAQSEWLNALGLASKAYGTYMLYVNESDHFSASWFSPDGIDALASIFTRAVDHLAEVGANHPGGVVPAETLSLLVSTLQQTKLHPDPAMASTTTTVTIADLVAKALLVKQAIFGGAGLAFDLNRAVELRPLIANAKRPAYRLYQILLQTDFSNMTDADFAKVVADFEGASTSVTVAVREFMAQAPAVTFSALTGLTQQLDPLFQLPTTHQSVDNAVALASGSRAVLLGPPYAGVQQAEWSPILDEAARLARLYLLTLRAPVPPASGGPSPQQLDYWWSLADSGIAFINDVITRHPAGSPAILTSEVLALLNGLPDSVARKSALLALIPDFMSLKQALFGGDAQGLQAGELVRIQALLAAVKGQSYLLRPYFPLDLSQIGTWTTARVDSLADAFSTATEALAASLGRGATASYSFSQLDGLLVKLSPLLTDPSMIANAREMIPVLSSLKAVILRPPYDSLAPAEWRELISSLGNWGALALRLDHFMSSAPDWYHGDALTRMQALSTELLQNLRNATVNHTPSEIAFGDLDRLLSSGYTVAQNHDISIPMQLKTVQDFLRPAVKRLMAGADFSAYGRKANGISTAAIEQTMVRLHNWASLQSALELTFTGLGGGPDALKSYGYDKATLLGALKQVPGTGTLQTLLNAMRPLFIGSDAHYSFLYDNSKEYLYSFNDLSKKNLYWAMVKMLTEGYAEDHGQAAQGLKVTAAEFQNFVVDVHGVIRDMKFGPQDLPDPTLAEQRFFEANVFTSVANGDGYFDLLEGIEYVGFLGSTKALSAGIWKDMQANCPAAGSDVYGRPGVDIQCFRARFFDPKIFASNYQEGLPVMVSTFAGLAPADQALFMKNIEIAARRGKYTLDPIDTFQAENFTMLMSYIEAMFKRFDVDRNGHLYMKQALAAFPLVCSKLKTVSGLPGTCKPRWGLLEALFGHLLVFGTVPDKAGPNLGDKIITGIKYLGWTLRWAGIRHCTHCSYRVDRSRILSVIEALAANSPSASRSIDFKSTQWGGPSTDDDFPGD